MKTLPLGRLLLLFSLGIATFGAASAAESIKGNVVSLGENTYSVTRQAPHTFDRDVNALKAAAQQDAAKFCAEQGKELKIVNVTSYRPRFISGYANAKVVFKALNPGDPELAANPAPALGAIATGSDDLYSELLKLDDLRKRGILTDEEFAKAKKKTLKRHD